ncbi:hypothetical protein Pelo_13676 [Pelomyxa schiedti]|nr:hypothetical protein Pelo_13676 [Pelomyxa schiedti]
MRLSTAIAMGLMVPLVLGCMAAIGCGVAVATLKSAVNRAAWRVDAMKVDSIQASPSGGVALEASFWASVNATGDVTLGVAVSRGSFSATLNGYYIGQGSFGSFTLRKETTKVLLKLENDALPESRATILDRYTSGEDMMLKITVYRMSCFLFNFGVNHTTSKVINILDDFVS